MHVFFKRWFSIERTLDNNKLILKLHEENIIVNLARNDNINYEHVVIPMRCDLFQKKRIKILKKQKTQENFFSQVCLLV